MGETRRLAHVVARSLQKIPVYPMPSRPATTIGRYGSAILAVALATLVRWPLDTVLHGRAPYALYFIAVVVIAWRCGTGPTVAASALSAILAWSLFVPQTQPGYRASIFLFLAVCVVLVALARAAGRGRAALEAALAESRRAQGAAELLAAIVTSSDDAILSKNLDGIIESSNAGAERVFGYRPDELIGKPVTTLIPEERQGEEAEILARIRRGERVEHFETVRVTKDGRKVDVSLTISPVRDASGRIVGASKIARNITERKRTEREIQAQREWLRVTLSSIGDAVIATDVEGRVVFMNPVAERLTGHGAHTSQGLPCAEVFRVVDEKTGLPVENPIHRVLEEGVVVGLGNHTVLIAADGREHPIDDSGAPIRGRDGAILGAVLVFRDVTDRRLMETKQLAAAAEREQLLASEKAARAEADRANRMKDDFVATISHELRTPLNAISGWAHLVSQHPDDPAMTRRGIEVIQRNARVQTQLLSELLDLSRIVAGKLQLEIEAVDLPGVVDDATQALQMEAAAKGVEIRRDVDRAAPPISADPGRLQQAVWNLLSNAVKFTPSGGWVRVALRTHDREAEITVSDNGIGIRPDLLPVVFERFRQGTGPGGQRAGGLGLGLAIAKQIVEMHGGTLSAASEGEGRGAAFTIRLPLSPPPAIEDRRRRGAAEAPLPANCLEGAHILVVEDDEDARELVRQLLESYHAEVVTAASAEEALEILGTARVDLLLSDIGLPGMDGYELIKRVRALPDPARRRIPAVALTAFARSVDRTRAVRAGFQAHIAKPVADEDLVATLCRLGEIRVESAAPRPL
jgi:PAS domain S-box-containing protein